MKNKNLNLATAAAIAAGIMLSSTAAQAEDLPQTQIRQQTAVSQGLGVTSLPVLQRGSAASQTEVSNALIQKLRPLSAHQSTNDAAGTLRTSGDQWLLQVSSDGSAAEFRDLAVEAAAHSLGVPLSRKMTESEMEQKGRAFIAAHLASHIVLGKGEQLLALRSDYRSEGGQDLATGKTDSAVVANRIVFGRTINGIPVVGNGSKVMVTFTNDGSVESFRYDWPTYQTGAAQTVAGPSEVLSRVQKVMGARTGESITSVVAVPANSSKTFPLALTPNSQLQALDCGYYDAGSPARKSDNVQPGCTYLTVSHDSNGMRAGYAGAVPAATSFSSDPGWLETQILSAK